MMLSFSKAPRGAFFAGRKLFKECTSTETKYTVLSLEKVNYKFDYIFMVKLMK